MSLIDIATKKSRKVSPVKVKQENSMLENISLNISIKQRQPLLVDNNLADLTINSDMVIQGTVGNSAITGRAQIDSGVVYFQKSEFDIIKGVVDFTNPYKIEPNIDIKAITDIRTWAITLMILETPDSPSVRNLSFKIIERCQYKITTLKITGNETILETEIMKSVLTKPPKAGIGGVYVPDVLRDDIKAVKALYHKHGFTKISVQKEIVRVNDPISCSFFCLLNCFVL